MESLNDRGEKKETKLTYEFIEEDGEKKMCYT
jgi:hypothetical protein